jgi:hypothetical protein
VNIFRITLRRIRPGDAVSPMFVDLSAKAVASVSAAEVVQSVQRNWAEWAIVGVERVP